MYTLIVWTLFWSVSGGVDIEFMPPVAFQNESTCRSAAEVMTKARHVEGAVCMPGSAR